MIDWVKWKLGIGWTRGMTWLCSGVTQRIDGDVEILREEYWHNRKTGEQRLVRTVRPVREP